MQRFIIMQLFIEAHDTSDPRPYLEVERPKVKVIS